MGDGRSVSVLEGDVGVRLSSVCSDPQGVGKDQSGRVRGPSRGTVVAKTRMVPGLSGTKSRASKGSSTVSRSVEAKLKRSVSSSSSCSKATRLATVAKGIEASGFSKEVAQRVALGGLRCSSLKVYDSRWNIFAKWCKSEVSRHGGYLFSR